MKSSKTKGRLGSKHPLAWVALTLIIVGSTSFNNYPSYGYAALGMGLVLGAYVEFFLGKKEKTKN